jgi:hypothetical protein
MKTLEPADRAAAQSEQADARCRAGRIPSCGRRHGCARQAGAIEISQQVFNDQDHSVSVVDRAGSSRRGLDNKQTGDVVLSWGGYRARPRCGFRAGFGHRRRGGDDDWAILRMWRTPARMRKSRRERRQARGRHAITQRTGDRSWRFHGGPRPCRRGAAAFSARSAGVAAACAVGAARWRPRRRWRFRAMAEREDTRLLGLRGLFIEAQRADDPWRL